MHFVFPRGINQITQGHVGVVFGHMMFLEVFHIQFMARYTLSLVLHFRRNFANSQENRMQKTGTQNDVWRRHEIRNYSQALTLGL